MSHCYKCGRELPGTEAECDPDCRGASAPTDEQLKTIFEMMQRQRAHIDWDKVVTPQDMMLVLKTLFACATVMKGTPEAETLKRFLKE
jgi:hypothetical protein